MLQTLDERREEFEADPDKAQAIVREDLLSLLDIKYSARLILGRAGRGISAAATGRFCRSHE